MSFFCCYLLVVWSVSFQPCPIVDRLSIFLRYARMNSFCGVAIIGSKKVFFCCLLFVWSVSFQPDPIVGRLSIILKSGTGESFFLWGANVANYVITV